MFRFRSIRTVATRFVVAISILSLLIAFILSISTLITGTHFSLTGTGSLHFPGLGAMVSAFLLIILMFANYTMVYKQVGWIKFGARQAAILLAIAEVILGFVFLGELVVIAGIMLFVAWIILEI